MTLNLNASITIPRDILDHLSKKSKTCIDDLVDYLSTVERPVLPAAAALKIAGVLVLLYELEGELHVLLTTRSKQLRTHAGQTALPGGKKDPSDVDLIATAFREANEEVGLPLDCPYIFKLGFLRPFISLHKILVTPVLAFLSRPEVINSLKPSPEEVTCIFSHPLEAILDPTLLKKESLVEKGSENWPYESELYNTTDSIVPMLGNTPYRMHRFRTSASPVKGLTADILIKTAEIAYRRPTTYTRFASGQLQDIIDVVKVITISSQSS